MWEVRVHLGELRDLRQPQADRPPGRELKGNTVEMTSLSSVSDPFHFDTDQDPTPNYILEVGLQEIFNFFVFP